MKNNLLSEKLVYTGDTRTPTHLHLVRYTPDEVHEYTADSLPPIEPQFSEKGMIWLQVHGLKETETVRQVCDRFGIDFLVMQDILNADHPTKVEEHERYMLVVAKFFRGGEEMQVCLVQGADFVLSFIESESPLFDDIPQAIRNNVLKFRSRPSDYLLSVLLNSITANYATLISKLDGDLDDLETGLLSTTDCRDTGGQIQELRHRYLQLKQAALPLRDQYAKLLHSDSALLHKNVRPFFNDVNDHLQYVVQQIDLCREYIRTHYGDAAAEHAVVFEDEGCCIPEGEQEKYDALPAAYSHLYLCMDGELAAVICIHDPLRREAKDAVKALHESGFSNVVMMTGDNRRTAESVAAEVGVDAVYAEVLPEDKAAFIRQEKEKGHTVIMVGDGVNDSPALSEADAGIAISTGAAIAREIADITVASEDLFALVTLRRLGEALMERIHGSYRFIVGFNLTLIALGVAGVLPPATSALLHNGSTLGISLRNMTDLLDDEENPRK